MYTKKEIAAMSNKQLVRAFENACYAVCHRETKTHCKNLDNIQAEILKRLQEVEK